MNTEAPNTAFDLLVNFALRNRACSSALPDLSPAEETWTGIGFNLGATRFLVPMGDISEILNLPPYTKIPRTKSFVRGAANIRGTIIPVIDLMTFFEKNSARVPRLRRVLVVEYKESFTGLIVDDILGMQHFNASNYQATISKSLDTCFHPFLSGTYFRFEKDGERENWPVMDLDRLLTHSALENLSA